MKIAVVLSGQTRNFNENLPSVISALSDWGNVTCFFNVWSESGITDRRKLGSQCLRSVHLNLAFLKQIQFRRISLINRYIAPENKTVTEETFKEYCCPTFYEIEDFHERFHDGICGVEVPKVLRELEVNMYRGQLPFFYKNLRALMQIREVERAEGSRFDLVARVQGETAIPEGNLALPTIADDEVLTDTTGINPDIQVSAKFAIGGRSGMECYLSLFNYLNEYWSGTIPNYPRSARPIGERLLKQHLERCQIKLSNRALGVRVRRMEVIPKVPVWVPQRILGQGFSSRMRVS